MAEPTGTRAFSAFEWMLSLRYLRARRKEGFISVIAGFSFLGIMLGVATLIIVMAVMNGFRKELLDKILGLNGHLLVQPLESPLTDWKEVAARIAKVDGVDAGRRRWSKARRWRRRRSTRPACWCAACAATTSRGCPRSATGSSRARSMASTTPRASRSAAGSPISCRCAPATTSRWCIRRAQSTPIGVDAADQALQDRRRVRGRHVGIRRRLRVHADHRGAGLFQPRRRRDRDRGLHQQSGPGETVSASSSPKPPAGRSS